MMMSDKKKFGLKQFVEKYRYRPENFTSKLGFFDRLKSFIRTVEWHIDQYVSRKENVFSTFWTDLKKVFFNVFMDFKLFLLKSIYEVLKFLVYPNKVKLSVKTLLLLDFIGWSVFILVFLILYYNSN